MSRDVSREASLMERLGEWEEIRVSAPQGSLLDPTEDTGDGRPSTCALIALERNDTQLKSFPVNITL